MKYEKQYHYQVIYQYHYQKSHLASREIPRHPHRLNGELPNSPASSNSLSAPTILNSSSSPSSYSGALGLMSGLCATFGRLLKTESYSTPSSNNCSRGVKIRLFALLFSSASSASRLGVNWSKLSRRARGVALGCWWMEVCERVWWVGRWRATGVGGW